MILRRLGITPAQRCATDVNCPDIFELADGPFAIIGTEMTAELDSLLPADASRGPEERIVVISRETLVQAKADIPDR